MSKNQERAMYLLTTYGECSEFTLWLEGFNRPRSTFNSLIKMGLVERVEYLNEDDGYLYRLVNNAS